jgi:hypothetical protein
MASRAYRRRNRDPLRNGGNSVSLPVSASQLPTITLPTKYNPSTYNPSYNNYNNTSSVNSTYTQNIYNPSTYNLYVNPTPKSPYSEIEELIFKIIDAVTAKEKIEDIITQATDLFGTVKGKEEIYLLIEQIEETICSILKNIADGVFLGIVINRIECLKVLVDKLEPTCCINHDGPIGIELLAILDDVTDKMELTTIISKMEIINTKLSNNLKSEEYIREAEEILLSIFGNICTGVDLGIVLKRVAYIQEIIGLIDKSCINYNEKFGEKLIEIIGLFSGGKTPTGKIDLDEIQKEIIIVNDTLQKRMACIRLIEESHELVNSIIQNISNEVDLGIVLKRVLYLKDLMTKARETYF